MIDVDPCVSFPSRGVIRIQSRSLFDEPENPACRQFLERVSHASEIVGITIVKHPAPHVDLRFHPRRSRLDRVVQRIVALLLQGPEDGVPPAKGQGSGNGQPCGIARRDAGGKAWRVQLDRPGRLRLKNHVLYRRSMLCRDIEHELMGVMGIERYRTSSLFSTVHVDYDPAQLDRRQVMEILEDALAGAERPSRLDPLDLHLAIGTASLPIAATAQFAVPALLPAAALVLAYTSISTFREARDLLIKEKRLGGDVLDAIVVLGCLGSMAIFPGTVLRWCVDLGRVLVKRTHDNSRKLILSPFGKQPRYARLVRDGTEVQVPLGALQSGDVIVVDAGGVVPADGHIVEGFAMIDHHPLTGETTPVEKGVGERIFAATALVAGKVFVSVERAGSQTASARIGRILDVAASHKLGTQERGERMADRAVLPTLCLGALGLATMGPAGAVAVLNRDFGTGIRMAAPLAMLTSLALCAHNSILIKDGRALELMNEVDTVVFDKTALLNRERPQVNRIIASAGFAPERILLLAAAAEQRFHHPLARAILRRALAMERCLPTASEAQYKVGEGIAVDVEGKAVRVGSRRFLEAQGIDTTPELRAALDEPQREGRTMVLVGVDGHLAGAIELRASLRPEAVEIVRSLRRRGIEQVAIISGDDEAPTRELAELAGVDRYFAQLVPADKARYVEELQEEGRKVCFVGDGINDSIAMKRANVSISMRGASSIAVDAGHIVCLDEGLGRLCELRDFARELDRNVKRSWSMILAPNIACVGGVFAMGFGIMASMVVNNLAAMAALGNGLLPLRKLAQLEAERRHRLEMVRRIATAAELDWQCDEPPFTISQNRQSFIAHFTPEDLAVDAESIPAAQTFATPQPRDRAMRLIEPTASERGS